MSTQTSIVPGIHKVNNSSFHKKTDDEDDGDDGDGDGDDDDDDDDDYDDKWLVIIKSWIRIGNVFLTYNYTLYIVYHVH